MPINIISWDNESVLAEYVGKYGVVHILPEILGSFEDEEDAMLTIIDEIDRLGLITAGQKMAFIRHAKNPVTIDYMRNIAKKKRKRISKK